MKVLKKTFIGICIFICFLLLAVMCTVWIVEQLAHRIVEVFMPYVSTAITKLEEKYEKL